MAKEIPTVEPVEITAGDTLVFKKAFGDYPAGEGWTLAYNFRGPADQTKDVTATADGDTFLINTSTSGWVDGVYWYQGVVTKDTEKYTIITGQLELKKSLAGISSGSYDGRSHVKKTLDALEATLEGKASRDAQEITLGGHTISKMDPDKLLRWVSVYRQLYRDELAKERKDKGLATGRRVLVKFK